ncbi:hypothetical protein TNCV_387941 [Trichonephila clavipes]|nr:hypothetical protein TNCV_387941 [Trichonephila clavipes]
MNSTKERDSISTLKGLNSDPGEGMNVCKCMVPVLHGATPNSRRAASPPVRFVGGLQGILAQNCGGTEPNRFHLYGAQSYS